MRIIDSFIRKQKGLSPDSKSVLTLVGGTTIAQVLNFLFAPVTTRLFTPEVFGDLSVFTSITGIVGIIVCLRYELAIILPQDDDEGFSLLKLSFIFAAIVSIATGFIFLFWGKAIYTAFGAKNLTIYWYYVPIILFLIGVIQASNYWLTRTRQFIILSWNKVIPVLVINTVSLGLGFAGYRDVGARIFAILISNIANIVVIAKAIIPNFKYNNHSTKYPRKELIKSYKNFLVYDIWGALLNNLSWMIIPILMNTYYGRNAAGQYSISLRIIQIPASIIGVSISQVFLKTANEEKYNKKLYFYCIKMSKKLCIYTAPIAIILLILSKPLFLFLFGENWGVAGRYTQILVPWSLLWFIASPLSSVYTICQKQNLFLFISILNLLTRLLSLYVGKMLGNDILGIILFSASGFIVYGISLLIIFNIAKRNDNT